MIASEMLRDGAVSIDDASGFSGLSRAYLYELMNDGKLAYTRVGTRRLIPRVALVELLADRLTNRRKVEEVTA